MGHITKKLARQTKKDNNKGGKKHFFQIKSKKKTNVLDFIPKGFPSGDFFTICASPIRTQIRVFERENRLSLGAGVFCTSPFLLSTTCSRKLDH